MTANLTPYQFERLIQLLEKEKQRTDSSFYCGLRNNLKEQYREETAKATRLLNEYFYPTETVPA